MLVEKGSRIVARGDGLAVLRRAECVPGDYPTAAGWESSRRGPGHSLQSEWKGGSQLELDLRFHPAVTRFVQPESKIGVSRSIGSFELRASADAPGPIQHLASQRELCPFPH